MSRGNENGKREAPDFVVHTCGNRDECWAEIDERTLGIIITDVSAAKRARTKHRLPYPARPEDQPCGFEATNLWYCPKYRAWAAINGIEPPEDSDKPTVFVATGTVVQQGLGL